MTQEKSLLERCVEELASGFCARVAAVNKHRAAIDEFEAFCKAQGLDRGVTISPHDDGTVTLMVCFQWVDQHRPLLESLRTEGFDIEKTPIEGNGHVKFHVKKGQFAFTVYGWEWGQGESGAPAAAG